MITNSHPFLPVDFPDLFVNHGRSLIALKHIHFFLNFLAAQSKSMVNRCSNDDILNVVHHETT